MSRVNRDRYYLDRLRDHYAVHGSLPSYSALSRLLGFRAKNASFKLAKRLQDLGYLQVTPERRLAPGSRFFERVVVDDSVPAGTGEAGAFSGGISEHEIDRLLVDAPSRSFLVTVSGDSMTGAGVLDGDRALVERTSARAGDFVVAMVDGRTTLKELRYRQGQAILVPHNERYETIEAKTDLAILGVVRAILRRYGRSPAREAS